MSFFDRKPSSDDVAKFIAGRLYYGLLWPIEKKMTEDGAMTLDVELMKLIFQYVKIAHQIISLFKTPFSYSTDFGYWQQVSLYNTESEDKVLFCFKSAFIYDREVSVTGSSLSNPIAYWIKELHWVVQIDHLDIEKITRVEICKHGDIIFADNKQRYNISKMNETFHCGECTAAVDIIIM